LRRSGHDRIAEVLRHAAVPTANAIEESVDLAHEIFNRVFRKVPERLEQK
jgi:hypothetical protein